MLQQGFQLFKTNQFQAALQSAQQALTIYRQIGDKAGEETTLRNIGLVYKSLGQYAQALKFYQQALLIAKEVGSKAGEEKILSNIGFVYLNLGQYTQAWKFHQQALDIAKQLGNKAEEGQLLTNIGVVHHDLGKYTQALKFLEQALVIHQQLGNKVEEEQTLINIGLVYNKLGQYPQALKFLKRALVIHQQLGNKAREGLTLTDIGTVYINLAQYPQALKFLKRALVIHQQLGNKAGEGQTLNNIGTVYINLAQYAQALKFYQQALVIFKQVGNKAREGQTFINIGEVYSRLGQYSQALKFFEQALVINHQLGNKVMEGTCFLNIGSIYANLRQNAQSLKFYQQALVIFKQVGNKVGEAQILINSGLVYQKLGQYADAEKALIAAIQILEPLRAELTDANKVSIFEKLANVYVWLQHALVAQNKIDAALEIAERGRARAFVELLARQFDSKKAEKILPPTIQQIQQIAKEQNATLVEYSTTHNRFKVPGREEVLQPKLFIWVIKPTGEVALRSVDLKPLWQKHNYPSLSDLVAKTRESVTQGVSSRGTFNKLTFSPGDLVRLNNDEPNWAPWQVVAVNAQSGTLKLKHPSFEEGVTIERSQADVVEKVTSFYTKNPHLQQLHQLLIQPITDLLPTDPNSRVVFIPQDSLFLVPFPALQDASGKYLIEQHTITTAPAIQVLDLTHRQRQRVSGSGKDALVVGNPIMPKVLLEPGQEPQQLESLPHAEQEAIEIAQLLQTKAITDRQANEAAIVQQLPKAQLIHLATHGILDEIRGLGSAIALAPSGTDDGLLTAEEILDLQLQAELVVLSACDTGQGRITGDGIIGLSRSLFAAGVPSVIVSLWSVPDAPTAPLMKEFYQQLQSNPDKAQALRSAMLKTMKKHPDPRDWAAFTLIGEAQ